MSRLSVWTWKTRKYLAIHMNQSYMTPNQNHERSSTFLRKLFRLQSMCTELAALPLNRMCRKTATATTAIRAKETAMYNDATCAFKKNVCLNAGVLFVYIQIAACIHFSTKCIMPYYNEERKFCDEIWGKFFSITNIFSVNLNNCDNNHLGFFFNKLRWICISYIHNFQFEIDCSLP